MSLAADTSPSLQACQHCALAFPTSRDLDRHVALDHTPDADGADLVALIVDPAAPPARDQRMPAGPGTTGDPASGSPATAAPWWRLTPAQALIAAYGLVTLFAAAPLLTATLVVVVLCVVTYRLRDRVVAWTQQPPTAPPGTRSLD